ncbi:hypothetical protein CK203_038803 [Vitis vinifera]|uniref:Uncharacterized protein n=1 Tax=Vitis vinifera TaxID=29760 RepID=A0A438I1K0_VITVI|nr:hypothetical protein CK203_038803 [Vitis vinifera]
MNFMSYVAEVSRGWDEPNARDMGRMTSQPNAKGEMYILNDGINMKVKITAMARRLEELEMKKMQQVQAISQTPLLPMPCSICRSYENLVDECPTIPTVREMFGDCNTYNSNWRDHPNFSWKPQPPHSVKEVITLRSGKEVDLPTCKLEHKVENEAEKEKREEIKGKKKGKSIEKDGYDVNEQRKPQRIVIKEEMMKHMPSSFPQALYGKILQSKSQARDANFIWDPGKLNHRIKFFDGLSRRKCKEIERKSFGAKTGQKQGKNKGLRDFAASAKSTLCCETSSQPQASLRENFRSCETTFGTRVPFRSTVTLISQLRNGCEVLKREKSQFRNQSSISQAAKRLRSITTLNFTTKAPFRRAAKWSAKMPLCCEMISKLRNGCKMTSKRRNGLQIAKLTCEMEEGLQKHLAKARKVAKMPTEPCDHAYEEESRAHPGITHTKPLTPFSTSLNHQIP